VTVTIKDIARAAGVSHSTVSRALSGHPAISPETVAKVKKIAARQGYIPSAVASGLKTNRSHALGVIVSRIDDPFFSEILQGIEDVVQDAGYSLFVAASNRDLEREHAIVFAMGRRRVDGVILCSTNLDRQRARQLQRYGIPIVAVENQSPEGNERSIYHDHFSGSLALTQHLIELGHRRIAYLGNARSGRTDQDRQAGFREAMTHHGLPISDDYIFHGPNGRLDGGSVGAQHFLGLAQRPTALVCFNDMMAIGVLHTLQQSGLRVPADCSVVGFDNIQFAGYTNPPLTTFEQPKYQLGYQAAQMMMRLLESSDRKAAKPVILKGHLVIRQSTAPPG
jgi:DNA-binding LacI/PurR family transcriptional regulator